MVVCAWNGGVPGLGQDVPVVLGVDQHAETQVVLHFPLREVLLGIGLFFLYSEDCLKIDPFHL